MLNLKEMNTQQLIEKKEYEISMLISLEQTLAQATMNGADTTGLKNEIEIRNNIVADITAELNMRNNVNETETNDSEQLNISVDFDNQIGQLITKCNKDLMQASKDIYKLNQICKDYNVVLKIVPGDRGIFANDEQHYKVVNTVREHLGIEDLRIFGEKAQHILEDIQAILYQVSVTQNKIYELRQLNTRLRNTTIDLINELQVKNYNSVDLITWHMVKRNIVGTLEQAQEIIRHLYKSKTIEIVDRIYTSKSAKVFVQVVPVTEIDEDESYLEYC